MIFVPIKIPNALPAADTLRSENIFVMTENVALKQDIRPLQIAILNLMPKKIETETQLLRLLGNSPLQIEITLLQTASHKSKNTSAEHLLTFYKTFEDVKDERFDGLIITGAPVEHLEFSEVDYWDELCQIFDWSKSNVHSTFHICWGAIAALNHHYGVKKINLKEKLSGVFVHEVKDALHPLLRCFDDEFFAPHSRYFTVDSAEINLIKDLEILADSKEGGAHLIASKDNRQIFVTGHGEYERTTLEAEYSRDLQRGIDVSVPLNYFSEGKSAPQLCWRAHSSLLFSNWINFIVYQNTPYDLDNM